MFVSPTLLPVRASELTTVQIYKYFSISTKYLTLLFLLIVYIIFIYRYLYLNEIVGKVEEILCYMGVSNCINWHFQLTHSHFITMRFRHRNSHTYGTKPWEFWVVNRRVTGAKYGVGKWLPLWYCCKPVGEMFVGYDMVRIPRCGRIPTAVWLWLPRR